MGVCASDVTRYVCVSGLSPDGLRKYRGDRCKPLRLVIQFALPNSTRTGENVLAVFILCLVAYASISVTKLLIRFNEENMEEIEKAAQVQEESNKKMVLVADNVMKHFDNAMNMLDNLENSIDVSHTSINNIAESTEEYRGGDPETGCNVFGLSGKYGCCRKRYS